MYIIFLLLINLGLVYCQDAFQCFPTSIQAVSSPCPNSINAFLCAPNQTQADAFATDIVHFLSNITISGETAKICQAAQGKPKTDADFCSLVYQRFQTCDDSVCSQGQKGGATLKICCTDCAIIYDTLCDDIMSQPCLSGFNCTMEDSETPCLHVLSFNDGISIPFVAGTVGLLVFFATLTGVAYLLFRNRRKTDPKGADVPLVTMDGVKS